ncbi:hypothetical protein ACWGLJ_23415 [Streptomyces sp. NPDC055898]|uniref:hypothetical protein n=2 Tax=unclassified Streptomyces TaxID=2593676 RepID=UPI0036E67853
MMHKNGYSEESTKALWDVMLPFSGYAFNKSHTAGYGLVSYWTAYLKANYPAEYMAALLISVGDEKDKAAIYLAPLVRHHVNMLGRYSFRFPELPGGLRPLRDKGAADDE